MYLIIGLGNPGLRYRNTRHNVGFMVLDQLSQRYHLKFKKGRNLFKKAFFQVEKNDVVLVKPLTFMNLSGKVVKYLIDQIGLNDYSDILIVADDINLPFGAIRLRGTGSSGGQKGLESIIQYLHSADFPRLRLGIGNNLSDASEYVLSRFNKEERQNLPIIIKYAADAVESFVLDGLQLTMSKYNRNVLEK